MTALAWIWIGLSLSSLLPGSSFKKGRMPSLRNDIEWGGPHIYLRLAGTVIGAVLIVGMVLR